LYSRGADQRIADSKTSARVGVAEGGEHVSALDSPLAQAVSSLSSKVRLEKMNLEADLTYSLLGAKEALDPAC
jgi:hypothetical protein